MMRVRFGVFTFDTDAGELRRDGTRVRLEPQPARALARLVERAGDLVTRDEMRDALWGRETHVDFDRGLTYCLGQVRAALGDSADNPRFVQTVPRRGYRFIAPVERLTDAPSDARESADADADADPMSAPPSQSSPRVPAAVRRPGVTAFAVVTLLVLVGAAVWAAWPSGAPDRQALAVAVFDNETGDAAYDPFVARLADAVVVRLTPLAPDRVGVVGNTAELRQPRAWRDPAAIARATGADYLVFGQLQREERGLRLVTHLIRLDDDTHLWVTRIVRPEGVTDGMEARMLDRLVDAVGWHIVEPRADAPRSTPEDVDLTALPSSH